MLLQRWQQVQGDRLQDQMSGSLPRLVKSDWFVASSSN
jgi:hypothetical protein